MSCEIWEMIRCKTNFSLFSNKVMLSVLLKAIRRRVYNLASFSFSLQLRQFHCVHGEYYSSHRWSSLLLDHHCFFLQKLISLPIATDRVHMPAVWMRPLFHDWGQRWLQPQWKMESTAFLVLFCVHEYVVGSDSTLSCVSSCGWNRQGPSG